MTIPSQSMRTNRLLTSLSAADYALIAPALAPVSLKRGAILSHPQQLITHACFPESGIGSVIAVSGERHSVEVGIFGLDGMTGCSLLLGVDRLPYQIIVQIPGQGHLISAAELLAAVERSRSLGYTLLRYLQAFAIQSSYTALSNAIHSVEERLARWLLMSHDRSAGDQIALTHDFLAFMLAVRRPTVTMAMHVLEGLRLIRSTRGLVTIVDRAGLEELATDSYGKAEAEYERIVGPMPQPDPKGATSKNVHQLASRLG